MRKMPLLAAGLLSAPAMAGTVSITIPQIKIAEYKKPYVVAWLEPADGSPIRTLLAWYNVRKQGAEPGTKYLVELRSWWRKGGRSLALPADGISGATRAPGTYTIALPADLKPGQYTLNVEAARESGGRELVSVPLTNGAGSASGKTELGAVVVAK
jgi:hypothetical protein